MTTSPTAAIKRNYAYYLGPKIGVSFDKQLERTLVLETQQSLVEKLCELRQTHFTTPYSIAAYDIDYDAGTGCVELTVGGAFRRLRLLRSLRDFFRDRFRDPSLYGLCLQVSP
ncbi:uncharacterized protein LOC144100113 [Amblyomma americanum]